MLVFAQLLAYGFFFLGTISFLVWVAIYWHPARPWDFQPVAEDLPPPPDPSAWPGVCILVPARNEAAALAQTLPALLEQDYPGPFHIILTDDRSTDSTGAVARSLAAASGHAHRLTVVQGQSLPEGWCGKVWALEQAATQCGLSSTAARNARAPAAPPELSGLDPIEAFAVELERAETQALATLPTPKYVLLTDADIRHAPHSLRRLVAESEADQLALNSRMARLRCESLPERLLIPPFVFFFNLLYPMRDVNNPARREAASAGGCVLLLAKALWDAGGFECIKGERIDDVSLARQIKSRNPAIRLSLSRQAVESLREYRTIAPIWAMVRRTAFTELRHSWLRLLGAVGGLLLLFLLPPLWLVGGTCLMALALLEPGSVPVPQVWCLALIAKGFLAWWVMTRVYRPGVAFFGLRPAWCWTLPAAGLLYGAMTVDSAIRHARGRWEWR